MWLWLWMCPDVDVAAPDAATCAPCVRACACQHCKCSATSPYSICSSLPFSLSLSLFPSASAVAYLPLRRSRLSLTKPRRDTAGRGIPAALLRSICDHFHITFTPPPSSFPLPAPTVGARLPPYVAFVFVCVCVYFCTLTTLRLRGLREISIWIFNFPFTVTRSQPLLLLRKHFA